MNTPIADFVRCHADEEPVRAHMPGHKGRGPLGIEALDITEIPGADSLYEADGIIRESETNAAALFGSEDTFYGTEGSSQCIRAMLYLVMQYEKIRHPGTERVRILAARGAHKALVLAAALLDLDIDWLWPEGEFSLCSNAVDVRQLKSRLAERHYAAVYVTSPDYLGNLLPVQEIAEASHAQDTLLVVDNAHGAYLAFAEGFQHPMEQQADLCCDSAHKTLQILTGGAYLHVGKGPASDFFQSGARDAMALFGSTSPSYLILQSLDLANAELAGRYREALSACIKKTARLQAALREEGWTVLHGEPLKITIDARSGGYDGMVLSGMLLDRGITCEYADPDFLVMMLSPGNTEQDFDRIASAFTAVPVLAPVRRPSLMMTPPETVCSIREAVFALSETIEMTDAVGRVLAQPTVSCPPAVPVLVSGERITPEAVKIFRYYGIQKVKVMR